MNTIFKFIEDNPIWSGFALVVFFESIIRIIHAIKGTNPPTCLECNCDEEF
jgi:hypothetical protein